MSADVAAIVAGLTKAQRRVIMQMIPGHWHSRYDTLRHKQPGSVMRHLWPRGLTEQDRETSNGALYHRLTPLGLSVRSSLQQGEGRDGG